MDRENLQIDIVFEDLFDPGEIQQIQDLFAEATGVASIITRPDGTPITRPSNFCRLCSQIIRKTEQGLKNCYCSDAAIGRYNPSGPIVQQCLSGGLWDAGSSITVGGRHVANWLIGQVRDQTQNEDQMRLYARAIGADEEEFLRAFREVPTMPKMQFERISGMLFRFANLLSESAYQNILQKRIIADREVAQQALRDSEEQLRMIGNNIPNGMIYGIEIDPEGNRRFTYVSEGVRHLHGCSPEEAMADPSRVYSSILPEDLPALLCQEREAIAKKAVFEAEVRIQRPGGAIGWSHMVSQTRSTTEGRMLWIGIETDVTGRHRAEEETHRLESQLAQSRKLEALGQLAGGIAHDLNNMLTPILGYSDLLLNALPENTPHRSDLDLIKQAAQRSRLLVRQLLTFARRQATEMQPIDLNRILADLEQMLRRMLRENVMITLDLCPEPAMLLGDAGQVEQIIFNLAVNAQDAIPGPGTLRIVTRRTTLDGADCKRLSLDSPGQFILLEVADNGCGMDEEVRQRIFDPFFTTKAPGKGTGLGLATVYGIVRQHSGAIEVTSAPSQGTTFRIHLPATEETAPSCTVADAELKHSTGGRILVVEDQDLVRNMVQQVLRRNGYEVVTAASGEEALQLFTSAPGFDLLLTDVIMTGMDGKELHRRLLEKDPGLEVLFMSGYAAEILSHQGALPDSIHLLHKPFTPRDLLSKIREILDRRPPHAGNPASPVP